MKKSISVFSIVAAAYILSGCMATGISASAHLTNVGLSNNNYRIVATSVTGEATSAGILGFSYGYYGVTTQQFVLIPITSNRTLYKNALQNLWENFEAKNGSAAGRTLALTNFRYDNETLNTVFYTKVKVVVIADVIEFK
jgi:hypothetical protein